MGKYQRQVLYLVQNSNTVIRTCSGFGKLEVSPFEIKSRTYAFELITVPLLSEVKQEKRPSGNGDREAIVVGAGLCDGEGERAYTVYDPILGEEKY